VETTSWVPFLAASFGSVRHSFQPCAFRATVLFFCSAHISPADPLQVHKMTALPFAALPLAFRHRPLCRARNARRRRGRGRHGQCGDAGRQDQRTCRRQGGKAPGSLHVRPPCERWAPMSYQRPQRLSRISTQSCRNRSESASASAMTSRAGTNRDAPARTGRIEVSQPARRPTGEGRR
jgi:hypothetical protein